jgi:NitT/TauT family transport system ATP-binding protein
MPWLTVNENIQLVLPTAQENKIETLLAQVGLANKGHYYPKQLSGGMQRRVAIARAFAVNPELILLDEPFNSLDAPTAAKLRLLLVNLCKICGSTVIFVTHDLSEAIYLADRILFISNSPSTIIHEVNVDLPKPRKESGTNELAWQANFMNQYPQILSGTIKPLNL